MKKFLVTILAFLYLATSAGATVHMHYCMGKIFSVDFIKAKDDCSKCGMHNSKRCCNDELKICKPFDTHNAVSANINLLTPVFAIADNAKNNIDFHVITAAPSLAGSNHSPPGSSGFAICILNCVFRL